MLPARFGKLYALKAWGVQKDLIWESKERAWGFNSERGIGQTDRPCSLNAVFRRTRGGGSAPRPERYLP